MQFEHGPHSKETRIWLKIDKLVSRCFFFVTAARADDSATAAAGCIRQFVGQGTVLRRAETTPLARSAGPGELARPLSNRAAPQLRQWRRRFSGRRRRCKNRPSPHDEPVNNARPGVPLTSRHYGESTLPGGACNYTMPSRLHDTGWWGMGWLTMRVDGGVLRDHPARSAGATAAGAVTAWGQRSQRRPTRRPTGRRGVGRARGEPLQTMRSLPHCVASRMIQTMKSAGFIAFVGSQPWWRLCISFPLRMMLKNRGLC